MKLKGKYSESTILYVILLSCAAVLAVAVFFTVLYLTGPKTPAKPSASGEPAATSVAKTTAVTEEPVGFQVSDELKNEMLDAVTTLIRSNYTVLKLYYTKGMDHIDEPYGNAPEDGYFTVDSETYTSLGQLEEIVDSTYIPECAEKVKTNPLGYGRIYKTRYNDTLGIIENFTPMEYNRSWKDPKYEIEPVSETECNISLTIHEKSDSSEVLLSAQMIKTKD
ncbi:MAG: hypothetical protein J6X60_13010, partial [Ruminiclostridium sp.]|nr:hypothetical protein [Ruminiclostridium sp.]